MTGPLLTGGLDTFAGKPKSLFRGSSFTGNLYELSVDNHFLADERNDSIRPNET